MQRILIGRITGAHGIRGAVKLVSFAATPADISKYGPLTSADGRSFEIVRLKPAKDEFIADLVNIRDRNAAEALQGVELFVPRDKLPALVDGEFYLSDLIGKPVDANGTALGAIIGIQNFGAGDLIELEGGALIPVAFITSVADKVTVELPAGFLDDASREDQHH